MLMFIVEDSPGDARLILEAILETKHKYHLFRNGDDLLNFIATRNSHPLYSRPDVIVIDLNLPGKSGFELLEILKREPDLSEIPIVILTSSLNESDRMRSLELKADAFLTKPFGLEGWTATLRSLQNIASKRKR